MKKQFLTMAVLALLALGVSAAEPAAAPVPAGMPQSYPWTFINLQFFPEAPSDAGVTETYGVKVGAPISAGEAPVNGVEASVLWAGSDEVNGLQCSLITCQAEEVTGIQFSLVNMSVKVCGLQLGIVNFADDETFQIGLLNFVENGPVFCLPIVNFNF
ncbi:hypothetical protein [uncultured Victivallis sp.]|uniref:LA_2272 family surface repeat-containing protein n=1 Tax=uncultured Victivallis sp. TaxID=354118 RepID=UPI0025D7C67A|nr:hypothetical protein [uncultured Victivallis sp.]